jgi:hypothetical protein
VFVVAAKKGNKHAEVHSREYVLEVVHKIYSGIVEHETKDIKSGTGPSEDGGGYEEKYTQRTGYATLEEGLLAHGLYPQKLSEWLKRFKEDDEVTEAIKALQDLRSTALVVNTTRGSIPASVGIFLMKAQLGYSDNGQSGQGGEIPKIQIEVISPSDKDAEA